MCDPSRRQFLRSGGLIGLIGLAGCTSVPFVGTLGFRLRNYTDEAYEARIEIRVTGRSDFEKTYDLPSVSGADPYVHTESTAISNVPKGMSYSVFLFLDGTEVETLTATMDCVGRDEQQIDEEIDINIGSGGNDTVKMADSQC